VFVRREGKGEGEVLVPLFRSVIILHGETMKKRRKEKGGGMDIINFSRLIGTMVHRGAKRKGANRAEERALSVGYSPALLPSLSPFLLAPAVPPYGGEEREGGEHPSPP